MQSWLSVDEFAKLVGKSPDEITKMCEENKLASKAEGGKLMIESKSGVSLLLPKKIESELVFDTHTSAMTFVEKTVGTILSMHEKVIDAKDETLTALKNENQFLKDGLLAMQELYDEDRKSIEVLTKQLTITQEELEFVKRKYKLMWGKAIDYAAEKSAKKI
ncbi:MAG: DUF3972 domain-containing protein [Helicobacteraceae bacterium]|jgi:hypothetical protein|nr:DUF3972 domain-containing protein [Helicobacteraceae bacterium]